MTQKSRDRINAQYYECANLKGTLDYILDIEDSPLRDEKIRDVRDRIRKLSKELLEIEFGEKLHTEGYTIYAV